MTEQKRRAEDAASKMTNEELIKVYFFDTSEDDDGHLRYECGSEIIRRIRLMDIPIRTISELIQRSYYDGWNSRVVVDENERIIQDDADNHWETSESMKSINRLWVKNIPDEDPLRMHAIVNSPMMSLKVIQGAHPTCDTCDYCDKNVQLSRSFYINEDGEMIPDTYIEYTCEIKSAYTDPNDYCRRHSAFTSKDSRDAQVE